jgi:hypothetical protein
MQTITLIVVVIHLYKLTFLGRRPILLYKLQIAFVASFPYLALFAKEDSLSY